MTTYPRVLHTEQLGGLTLTVQQPFEGAGLEWWLRGDHPILGKYTYGSPGRFYPDQHGEVIHGKTEEDVVAHAVSCAKQFCCVRT